MGHAGVVPVPAGANRVRALPGGIAVAAVFYLFLVSSPEVGWALLLGYGHFTFESAAQEQGLRLITFVPKPLDRDLVIQRHVQMSGLRGPRPDQWRYPVRSRSHHGRRVRLPRPGRGCHLAHHE